MFIFGLRILNQLVLGRIFRSKLLKGETGPSVSIGFRAWPIDLDFNWHLNNASYLKTAELARFLHNIALYVLHSTYCSVYVCMYVFTHLCM